MRHGTAAALERTVDAPVARLELEVRATLS
jgi:hypothetical protein